MFRESFKIEIRVLVTGLSIRVCTVRMKVAVLLRGTLPPVKVAVSPLPFPPAIPGTIDHNRWHQGSHASQAGAAATALVLALAPAVALALAAGFATAEEEGAVGGAQEEAIEEANEEAREEANGGAMEAL